jgi:hypothetical protein
LEELCDDRRTVPGSLFDLKQCPDDAMLREVIDFSDGFLGAATRMTDGEIAERYRCCPRAFTCVLRNDGARDALHGYFVLLPLNETGTEAIRRGSVSTGREITGACLAPSDTEVTALYLSVVCATHPRARAAAIRGVVTALRTYHRQHHVRRLFVRAATNSGSRILQRLVRTSFSPDGLIHEVDLSTYGTITSPHGSLFHTRSGGSREIT